jgi:LPS-assembly protein
MSRLLALVISIVFIKQIIFANTQDNTYINSNNITYDEKNNIVTLSKNSKINISDTNILVDRGVIDYNSDRLEVFGNFYLYQELNMLSGKNLIGNTNLTKFEAKDVSYIYNDDLKIDSESFKRSNDDIVLINNFLTPCELEGFFNCPTWSLRIDKTHYKVSSDKFIHFDTFFQIADYKIFYLPYFTHYGSKAPRQKGFLTPSLEFTIGGNSGIKTPYYLPFRRNTDMTITPTFTLTQNFKVLESYKLNTIINNLSKGGNTNVSIDTIKNTNNNDINNTFQINTRQIINKNMLFSANGLFTNSISTTRSTNEKPVTFEDIFIKLENYNAFNTNDYLKTEIKSVESFGTEDVNKIPLIPNIYYYSQAKILDKAFLSTHVNYTNLFRNQSSTEIPSENKFINIDNYLNYHHSSLNINSYNSLNSLMSLRDYSFNNDENLDRQEKSNEIILSSDNYYNLNKNITPRIKFIYPLKISFSDQIIDEDSNAISFNYTNQFSDKRYYGYDIIDNTSRIVYGLENKLEVFNSQINFNINQAYDFNNKSNFANKINQKSNYSDYSLELSTINENINFRSDLRLDVDTLIKKEINYNFDIKKPINLNITYNETNQEAYNDLSEDNKDFEVTYIQEINDNVNLSFTSNMDLKNDFSPYRSELLISLFDECSKLNIGYLNTRYNDSYNTTPTETISLTYSMDYLGFFGYEQSTDLFFEEAGNFNYGS